jgi:2-polyprenyl-3-methyl-5-hydroxy-6-metoxy-1,4-benzoquinol methylase
MRYGIIPTSIPERIALAAKKVPLVVVDLLIPLIQTRTLMNMVRLGVFDALADAALSADKLAAKVGADASCLELALRVMESAGYIRREQHGWGLTELSRRTLVSGAAQDSRNTVNFAFYEWDMLEQIDELLTHGKSADFHSKLDDAQVWGHYQGSMLELARGSAPLVAPFVPVAAGARLLLDVAGSHGLLGASVCRLHPGMKSIVLDLPEALPHARKLAEQAGISDIVEHRELNMLTEEFPSGADVVLFGNILHHFTPEQNLVILRKAQRALKPGGTLAIWDVERRPAAAPPELAGDAMALFFRLTSNSATFSVQDYQRWMSEADFAALRARRHLLLPSMVMLTGLRS